MAPTLYMTPASAPVRAVLMAAKCMNLELNLKHIDLAKGEQKTTEFGKLNPQHTVPTLVDEDGFTIWDSHVIMSYLVSKYAKHDLYPEDRKKRAVIDQRLHFDSSVALNVSAKIFKPIFFSGKKTVDQADINSVHEVYSFLEGFLEGNQWIAGDSLTIADFSLIAITSTLDIIVKIDGSKYPKLVKWLKNAEAFAFYEANKAGLETLSDIMKSLLK